VSELLHHVDFVAARGEPMRQLPAERVRANLRPGLRREGPAVDEHDAHAGG